MVKIVHGIVMVALILIGAVVPAATAHAVSKNDASITNTGNQPLLVCKDWGVTICKKDSPKGFLMYGENSKKKFGWTDTDGYWIPTKCGVGHLRGARWVQTHGAAGLTYKVTIRC